MPILSRSFVASLRAGGGRVARPARGPASPTAVLRRQWTRAVQTVAELTPDQPHARPDPSFEQRAELVAALGEGVAATTIARNLNELEDHGYVSGDPPLRDRRRRLTRWTLNNAKLHADLRALIQATTPSAQSPTAAG